MERAKRRLLFSLFQLGVSPVPKSKDSAKRLSFRLLAEGEKKVMTGHFGDESVSYADASKAHYAKPPDDLWKAEFISSYAASDPWEDWAEAFAHFLHMRDVVETSRAVDLIVDGGVECISDFEASMKLWLSTTFRINQIGRSIGSGGLYPFVLNDRFIEKMRFIHGVVFAAGAPQVQY